MSAQGTIPNLARDASRGVDFSPVNFVSEQKVLVPDDSGIESLADLSGSTVGTTSEANNQILVNALSQAGVSDVETIVFNSTAELFAAYDAGEIDALFAAQTTIVSEIPNLSEPDNQRFLDEALARVPSTLVVDENQSAWADVVNWVTYTLIQAEEFGITSGNVDEFLNSDDPAIRQFLGLEGNLGGALGLSNDFTVNVIKAVGNYEEVYQRNFDEELIPRGLNSLADDGGILFSNPFAGVVQTEQVSDIVTVGLTPEKQIATEGETFAWNFSLDQPAPKGGLSLFLPIIANNDPAPGDVEYFVDGSSNISDFEFVVTDDVAVGFNITISEGATEATLVSEAIVDDITEIDEIATIVIADGANYRANPEQDRTNLVLTEFPVVSISPEEVTAAEGETFAWNFSLNHPAPKGGLSLFLPITVNNDPALGDVEFNIDGSSNISEFELLAMDNGSASFNITIAEGATEATLVSEVVVDNLDEETEIFTTVIADGADYRANPAQNQVTTSLFETSIYDLSWEGENGYTMKGFFSFSSELEGSIINENNLIDMQLTFFEPDGSLLQVFDYDFPNPDNSGEFNFNFDSATDTVIQSGESDTDTGFDLGIDFAGGETGIGFFTGDDDQPAFPAGIIALANTNFPNPSDPLDHGGELIAFLADSF